MQTELEVVNPLSPSEQLVLLPEVAVQILLGATVGGDKAAKQIGVRFEGETTQMHADDFEVAKKIASRVLGHLPKKISPGIVIRAMTLAHKYAAEEVFAPGRLRVIFYASLSKASAFYRCMLPMLALNKGDKVIASVSRHRVAREALGFDVVVIQLDHAPTTLAFAKTLKQLGKKIVFEIDDAFDALEPWHSMYELYQRPEERTRMREMIGMVDAITVTTPALAEHYAPMNPSIHVVPNFVTLADWPKADPNRSGVFRVLWAGSPSHWGDLETVAQALKTFAQRHDNVQLVFFGRQPPDLSLPKHQVEFRPFTEYNEYPVTLAEIKADVTIAPLSDVPFNRYKSPIKLLEYAATGYPVIASDVGPYHDATHLESPRPFMMVPPDHSDAWLVTLETVYSTPELLADYKKRGTAFVKKFDIESNAAGIESLFLKLGGKA